MPPMSGEDERQFARAPSSPRCSRSTPARRSSPGRTPLERGGRGAARRRRPRRAVRGGPAPAAARGPRDREHRHQRLRPGLRRLRGRPRGPGRAGRRDRRGTGRADPGAGGLLRAVPPPVRHRQPPARPAAARRLPAVGGDGRHAAARAVHPAGPAWARSSWPTSWATARSPPRSARSCAAAVARPEEHHDRRGDQRRARPRCCGRSPTRSRPQERLITVERALELGLDQFPELHPNVVAFEERLPNSEGSGRRSRWPTWCAGRCG